MGRCAKNHSRNRLRPASLPSNREGLEPDVTTGPTRVHISTRGISHDRQMGQAGHKLPKQFEPLGHKRNRLNGQTGYVAARMSETRACTHKNPSCAASLN
jgi:hypothetical protein